MKISRWAWEWAGLACGIGLMFASALSAPAGLRTAPQAGTQQTKRPAQADSRFIPDLKLMSFELWISNPGEKNFGPGRPITTDSLVRLFVKYRNAGLVPVNLRNVTWGVIEGPFLAGRIFSTAKVLQAGEEDSDVLDYFGPGKLGAGKYSVEVELDPARALGEKDRTNNALTLAFEVRPSSRYSGLPDLRIREAKADLLSSCGRIRAYRITATVANEGTAPAHFTHGSGALRIEPPLDATPSIGAGVVLFPKETLTLTYETSLEAGSSKKYLFTTDRSGEVKESDEKNNTRVLAVSAPPVAAGEKGDLAVGEAYVEYTTGNQLYWLVVTLKNAGPNPLTLCKGTVVWQTVDPPAGLGWTGSVASARMLKPGEVFEPSQSAHGKMPAGTYTFMIKVDPKSLFEETNEANNVFILKVRVPEDVRRK